MAMTPFPSSPKHLSVLVTMDLALIYLYWVNYPPNVILFYNAGSQEGFVLFE
jgi:hypothetical protein